MNYFKILSLFIALALGHSFYAQSDGCTSATVLPVTANCSSPTAGTTLGATQTIPGCVGNADDDVWYQFTATSTTHNITVDGATGFDAVVQLFSGPCSALVSLGCQDQTFDGGVETIFASGLTIGAVYRIRVYDYYDGSGSGNFTICVTPGASAPANDECVNATLLSVNGTCTYTSSTSLGATLSQPGCAGNADDDVWFSFVATNSVQTITVDPSSSMDPVVQLFEGSCGALNSLYCEDSGFTNGNEVINAIGLTPGNTYFIRVYDYYTGTGGAPFQICVEGTPSAAPTNDEPCNAIALPPVTSACDYLNFTTTGATASMGAPTPFSCAGGSGAAIGGFSASSADVWFTITVPASGNIFITPQPSYGINDGVMALYSGTCGSLTQVVCSDDSASYPGTANDFKPYIGETGLTPGDIYYLRYWGFGSSSGDFGICVSDPTNDDCVNALYICDINGYSASTSAAYTEDRPGTGAGQMYGNGETTGGAFLGNFNTAHSGGPFGYPVGGSPSGYYNVTIDNNSWISFTASATTATLNVAIYDCWVGNFPSGGIQMQVFSGTNCDNFVPVSNFEESSTGFTLTATGLTVGQDYYLVIDGYAGDICNYTITADTGVQFPEIEASVNPICQGEPTTLTAPAGATSYLWSPGGATTPSIIVNPSTTTTYTCVVEGVCGYKQTLSQTISVNQLPTINNSLSQTICSGTVFNQTLTADLTSTYEWSATPNGNVTGETTTTQTSSTINNTLTLTSATAQVVNYNITPTAISSGCEGPVQTIAVTVNPLPIVSSGASVCVGSTITLSPTTGGSWTSSNTGVATITNGGVVTGVSSGAATFTFTNSTTNCSSTTASVTVNPNITPTFAFGTSETYCNGATVPTLPTTSTNGITGTWSPTTVSNSASNNYVFTPTSGLCATGTNFNVTIDPNITPTFAFGTSETYCNNATVPTLPTTSTNGITGTWSPTTVSNTVSNNYVFTPTAGLCATGTNFNVTIEPNVTPTFAFGLTSTVCENGSVPTLPTTSTNGITGTWSPSTVSNTASDVYTFTPTAGLCATTTTFTQTIDPNITPTFAFGTAETYCNGATVPTLPTTSTNGITGTWSPATVSNTASNNYVFTPTAGLCATGTNFNVTIEPNITPTFTFGTSETYCNGASVPTLPTTSTNGITGTWSPTTVSNTASNNYVFTPTAGLCATGTNFNVTIEPNVTPTFAFGLTSTVCENGSVPTLPSTSTNGITGTWSPSTVSNTASDVYTFTPTAGLCATTTTFTQTIDPNITPTFAFGTASTICANGTVPNLPNTSTNGITGTWSPATVSNTASDVYTFTPTPGLCANTFTYTQTVNSLPVLDVSGISLSNPTACAATDGSITGITATGTPTLSYSWNGGASQPSPNLTGVGSGTYSITVTDGNSCTASAGPFSLSDPNPPATPSLSLAPGNLCETGSFTINIDAPIAGATYNWTSTPAGYTNTGNSVTITNAVAGTISYQATPTLAGCIGSAGNISVTVNALPNVDVLPPLVVSCDNPTITLDGSNSAQGMNINYEWNASNGGVIIGNTDLDTAATSTPGDYELTVENTTTGCTNSEIVTVSENLNTPTADVSTTNGGLIDCINTSLVLDGTGSTNDAGGTTGIIYTWSNTSGGTSIGSASTFTANAAGDYYLLVEETISGCTDEVMITITADANIPTALIDAPNTLTCANTTVTLNGANSLGSPLDYEWTDASSTIVGSNSTLDVTTPGQYTLEVTNTDNNCTNTVNVTVTEDVTVPTVSVVSPLVVSCNVPEVNLNGTGSDQGAEFIYTWTTADGVIIGNTNLDTAATSNAGTYNLLVTNTDNGCTANADIIVTMDTVSPIADAGLDVNFPCGVTSVALDGSASSGNGITYDWTGPTTITDGTTDSPSVNGAGQYTLTVTATNGCTDTDVVDVIPDVNAPLANAGTAIVITCNNNFPVVLDGSGSDSGADITYVWTATLGGNISADGTTTTPTVDQAGTYVILVTNTSNNCTATATVTVSTDTISPVADVSATVSSVINCNSNLVTTLDGSNSTGTGLTYSWSTSNGNINSQNGANAIVSTAGDYLLTVEGTNGCQDSQSITVTIDTISPIITVAGIDTLNCNLSQTTIDASASNDIGGTYAWTTSNGSIVSGDNTNELTVGSAGEYTLTITNSNGCEITESFTVISAPNPIADFTPSTTNGQGPLTVDYSNNSLGYNLDYDWNFGDGNIATDFEPSNTFEEYETFTTTLIVTDEFGCTDTASVSIIVNGLFPISIPDGFSPNGDNTNDNFVIENIDKYPNNYFTVMNRWGNIVYEEAGYLNTWNGTSMAKVKVGGEDLPTGTYFYILDLGEDFEEMERIYKGFIYLNR